MVLILQSGAIKPLLNDTTWCHLKSSSLNENHVENVMEMQDI